MMLGLHVCRANDHTTVCFRVYLMILSVFTITVDCHLNIHNKRPISRPLGWVMGCVLWFRVRFMLRFSHCCALLTHCGLLMPYGIMDLSQHWFSCLMATSHYLNQWPHNECDGFSNHQPHAFLLRCLFRRRSKKTSKLRVTGICEGNSPVTGEFPAQMASTM